MLALAPATMPHMICPCCGEDVSSVQREIKLALPDQVLPLSEEERNSRIEAGGSSFLQMDGNRFFVRGLLPVRLSDGHEFRFGVWLEIPEPTAKLLKSNWDRPEYAGMRFEAVLANAVPPWNESILGSQCIVHVRDRKQLPYVQSSDVPALAAVLTTPWARSECEQLLDAVWGPAPKT